MFPTTIDIRERERHSKLHEQVKQSVREARTIERLTEIVVGAARRSFREGFASLQHELGDIDMDKFVLGDDDLLLIASDDTPNQIANRLTEALCDQTDGAHCPTINVKVAGCESALLNLFVEIIFN